MQVQIIFETQGIDLVTMRCQYASIGMKGAAMHWYLAKIRAHNNIGVLWNDWAAFKTAVTIAFQPPNYQAYLRQQLERLRQTGSVRDYTTQFQNIIGQVEDMGDMDQVTNYLRGLKPSTRTELSYRAPVTLEEAIGIATRFDTAMWGFSKPSNNNKSRSSNYNNNYNRSTPKDDGGPMPMDLSYLGEGKSRNRTHYQKNKYSNNKNNNQHNNGNSKGSFKGKETKGNCFKCGKPGHYAKECRSQKQSLQALEENNEELVHVELTQAETNRDQLLRFNGKVNGKRAWILLDSGASRNFINEKFVRENHLKTKTTTPITVELADGRKQKADQMVTMSTLQLDDYKTTGITAQVIALN